MTSLSKCWPFAPKTLYDVLLMKLMWISFCLSLASQFMIFLCVCHSLENPAGSMYALAGKGLNLSVHISVEINPWPQTPLFNQFWLIFRIVLKEGFHYGMQRFCAHVETHVYPSSLLLSLLFHLPLRLQLRPVAFLVCSFLCSLLPSFLGFWSDLLCMGCFVSESRADGKEHGSAAVHRVLRGQTGQL